MLLWWLDWYLTMILLPLINKDVDVDADALVDAEDLANITVVDCC